MDRKKLKQNARKSLFKNYFASIFVCFVMLLVVGSYSETKTELLNGREEINRIFNINQTVDVAEKFNTSGGTFKVIFDMITKSKEYINHITDATIQLQSYDFKTGLLLCASLAVTLLVSICISNILRIGEARFFLENRKYHKTTVKRLFYGFNKAIYLKLVKARLLKSIYTVLWDFTIIGGIIKHYSYYLVDFILAENPDIKPNEAITLSRNMMNGNKFNTFIFDLSFILWDILNLMTFGLVGALFLNPYKKQAQVELYTNLKEKAQECKITSIELLNDLELNPEEDRDYYPGYSKEELRVKTDYYKQYDLVTYILFFFTFAIVGWLWEAILYIVRDGVFVNRGTLHGPWLPIYGAGCLAVTLLLIPKRLKKILDNPIKTLFLVMLVCTLIEYITAWYLETFVGMKYWDYSTYFLNIKGRVCLECSLFFGIGGCLCIYMVAPFLSDLFKKIPREKLVITCVILVVIFTIDEIYSSIYRNEGDGITNYNTQELKEQQDEFINNKIQQIKEKI